MASSGAVLSIGRRMCFQSESRLPAPSGPVPTGQGALIPSNFNGEQQLGGAEDGIPHIRVSRHWPPAICTFVQMKWSYQQEAFGWQKPAATHIHYLQRSKW